MSTFMLRRPNGLLGVSRGSSSRNADLSAALLRSPLLRAGSARAATATPPRSDSRFALKTLASLLLSVGLLAATASVAAEAPRPAASQPEADASKAVQPQVDKQAAEAAADKRRKLLSEATAAIAQTQQALKALEDKKNDEALKALADVTGKLELIVARDPKLALAPVSTTLVTYDLYANPETVKLALVGARRELAEGEIQRARPVIDALASEIQIRTSSIPLATYPAAIKAVTPLIDAGRVDEAKAQLQAALGTLVITTEVIPLPKLRAEGLLKDAQGLAEKKDRSKDENDRLAADLEAARRQLQMAELLGYGKKRDYRPLYEQIDGIKKSSAGGKSGLGWFDEIKQRMKTVI